MAASEATPTECAESEPESPDGRRLRGPWLHPPRDIPADGDGQQVMYARLINVTRLGSTLEDFDVEGQKFRSTERKRCQCHLPRHNKLHSSPSWSGNVHASWPSCRQCSPMSRYHFDVPRHLPTVKNERLNTLSASRQSRTADLTLSY